MEPMSRRVLGQVLGQSFAFGLGLRGLFGLGLDLGFEGYKPRLALSAQRELVWKLKLMRRGASE